MRNIICIAQSRWSSDTPERPQQWMQGLSSAEISYFELTVTSKLSVFLTRRGVLEVTEPQPGVKVYRLPLMYFHRTGVTPMERFSRKRTAALICQCLKSTHIGSSALLWCATPIASELIGEIPHNAVIYDCYRPWEQYPKQLESELAYDADLVLAASENLMKHVSPCNPDTFLIPNGCNYSLFALGRSTQIPRDPVLAQQHHPIFGYLGDVERSMDLQPIIAAAKEHPDWTFALIGRVRARHPDALALKDTPNIVCTGRRRPHEVAGCLAACDVCFDLRHNDIADEDVIPERIYGYFAAEKPVVCLYPRRYIPKYDDVIYSATTTDEFELACRKAINEAGRRRSQRRGEYARRADWSVRIELLEQILRENGLM